MSRISGTFSRLKDENRTAFIAYVVAGDPRLEVTRALVPELERRGVDLIELGVPFSDPMADGAANQAGAQRALKHNVSLADVLGLVRDIRNRVEMPIVLFTYFNPVHRFGIQKFATQASEAGVDGVLAVDLPPEESEDYRRCLAQRGLDTIYLIAPTSRSDRIRLISDTATGFVYYVSSMGVTGERQKLTDTLEGKVAEIRRHTDKPVAVGFGISQPDQVRQVGRIADAVVVGSAIVRRVGEYQDDPDLVARVGDFVGTLVEPLRETNHGSG